MTERIAVLIDYQNVHLVGHGLFGGGQERYWCVPDPVRVADLIAGRRQRASVAAAVRVYRGRPDPNHQPKVTAATMRRRRGGNETGGSRSSAGS